MVELLVQYTYDFLYDVGGGFVSLGRFTFPLKLTFIAPMHSWGSLEYGLNINFPLQEWAVFKNFKVLKNFPKSVSLRNHLSTAFSSFKRAVAAQSSGA